MKRGKLTTYPHCVNCRKEVNRAYRAKQPTPGKLHRLCRHCAEPAKTFEHKACRKTWERTVSSWARLVAKHAIMPWCNSVLELTVWAAKLRSAVANLRVIRGHDWDTQSGRRSRPRTDKDASWQDLAKLFFDQGGQCAYSGRALTNETASLDHRTPVASGGGDLVGNLQWLHRDVNKAKADLTEDAFLTLCTEVTNAQKQQ